MAKKKRKSFKTYLNKFIKYIMTNRLFLSYVLTSLLGSVLIRTFTVGHGLDYKPFIVDLALILIIGSFGYLIKPKRQFHYFFT